MKTKQPKTTQMDARVILTKAIDETSVFNKLMVLSFLEGHPIYEHSVKVVAGILDYSKNEQETMVYLNNYCQILIDRFNGKNEMLENIKKELEKRN